MRKLDLTGQRYGRLTVEGRAVENTGGRTFWSCKCDCGRTKRIKVDHSNLRQGRTRSCGCLAKERYGSLTFDRWDRSKARHGLLINSDGDVQRVNSLEPSYSPSMRCRCDCGCRVEAYQSDLLKGFVTHCGCGIVPRLASRPYNPVGHRRRSRLNLTEIAQAFLMRCEQGKTYPEIADALKVSKMSIGKLLNGLTREKITERLRFFYHRNSVAAVAPPIPDSPGVELFELVDSIKDTEQILKMLEKEVQYRWRDSLAKTPVALSQVAARGERRYKKMENAVLKQQIEVYRRDLKAQEEAADAKRRRYGISAIQMINEEKQRVLAKQRADGVQEGLVEPEANLSATPEDDRDYSQTPEDGVVAIRAAADGPSRKYLSCGETAVYLGNLNARTVSRWAREGYLPAIPLGEGKRRLWRFLQADLDGWMEARRQGGQLAA